MICKNLVFSFSVFPGFEKNEAIRVHLACLKRFSHVFDNALFVILAKDAGDTEAIKSAEKAIIDCGFKNVKFKVSEMDVYFESAVFKHEIIDKINSFEGLTFFGHTKGVTNVDMPEYDKTSILRWIAGMYYLNLSFVDEVEWKLIKEFRYSLYGAYKVINDTIENKHHTWYAGTFFWMNTNRVANNMKQRGLEFPKIHDRGYAEFMTGEIDELSTHGEAYLFPFSYNDAGYLIEFLLLNDEGEIKKYREYEKALGI